MTLRDGAAAAPRDVSAQMRLHPRPYSARSSNAVLAVRVAHPLQTRTVSCTAVVLDVYKM